VDTTYAYDPVSRLTSVLHKLGTTVLDGASHTYDNAGNRKTRTDKRTNVTLTYGYDNIYQLKTAKQGTTTKESYTYDLVGNRLSSLGVNPYNYNSSNELTSTPSGSYTYDNNGNRKTDPSGAQYSWDFENRLAQVILPGTGGTVNFKYDPFGRRIQKAFTQNGTTTTTDYLSDGVNILETMNLSGTVLARYTDSLGIDEPLSELVSGTTSYYEQDVLGSVSSLSNSAGALANTYTYDSYGKLTASTGTTANPFQYTGREFDSETGIYYYRARYYDQAAGRFLSEDPLGFRASIDFYSYAGNSPVNEIDPSGLAKCIYSIVAHTLICMPNADPGWPAIIGPNGAGAVDLEPAGVWSGVGSCSNNPSCVNSHDLGPIVPGSYNMNRDDRSGHSGFWRLEPNPKIPGWKCDLGLARCGFELHPGSISLGCITTSKTDPTAMQQYNNVNVLLSQENGSNSLTVIP